MQYVLHSAPNDQYFLVDGKEIIAIKEGVIAPVDVNPSPLPYRLMYGTYKPQPHALYDREDVRAHITEAMNQRLIHIDGRNVIHLRIEAMVVSEGIIKRQHTQLQHPRATQDIAFVALVKAPASFDIDDKHYQTRTAYLHQENTDAITTLRHCDIGKGCLPSPVKTNDSHPKSR